MKKIIVFLLTFATVFGMLTACKKKGDDNANKDDTPASAEVTAIGDEPVSIADTGEYLVNGGKTDYKIVIGKDSTKTEKYAAEELQNFIKQSTTVEIPVVSDAGVSHDNNGRYISVGDTAL
mgnify:FL=1